MFNRIVFVNAWRLLLLVGLIPGVSFSQNKVGRDSALVSSSLDTLNVKQFGFSTWVYGDEGSNRLNSIDGTHDFFPLYGSSLTRNDLGNIVSADQMVLFNSERPFGFNLRSGRKGYWKGVENRSFLLSDKMFSNVHYVNGANKESFLNAELTRGFGELLDMGFSFNRINSAGAYNRQKNVFTDLSVYTTFHSNDDRYSAVALFDYKDINVEENGGLLVDSLFEQNLVSIASSIPVALNSASNRWKGFDVGLEQRFFLLKTDSTRKAGLYRPAISHSFSASRSSMIYADIPDTSSGFYENIYFDTTATYDSINVLGITNTFRFELVKSDSVGLKLLNRLTAGVSHQYYRVAYDSLITKVNNVGLEATANGTLFKGLDWNARGNFMLAGYNMLDARVDAGLDYRIGGSTLGAELTYSRYRADLITANYVSNNFVWDNAWTQTNYLRTGVSYEQKRLRLKGSLTYHLLEGLVVFGTDRLPFQSTAVNQLLVLRLREHFRLRWFHLIVEGAMQTKLSGDDIRVPFASGRGHLYYQNDLFKGKLRLQIGVEANYMTAYFANAYNPALSAFYIQNDRKIGNYPFIDVFLNLRIKKFRAFFKVEHVTAGLFGYTYYLAPGYPATGLAWKFGINWAFLD
ncbi:MAG: hypothetical protein JKX84_05860 [Flavobacteriales bacterium]|nr:hypothetical protein [Flavobacteriales bacterium]